MFRSLMFSFACASIAALAFAQEFPNRQRDQYNREGTYRQDYPEVIPSGTHVRVRTDQAIDVRDQSDGRIYPATVAEDVYATDGALVIRRGERAELIVHNLSRHDMVVDLESVTAQGRRYMVAANTYDTSRRTGVGANRRTGEYVGGGALFGTIIGAIAGGGKGAAIGALAGGAAGAGAQALTRGASVHIAPETVLTFRLDQPLEIGRGRYSQDNGFDRDGYHYHNDYYRRDR